MGGRITLHWLDLSAGNAGVLGLDGHWRSAIGQWQRPRASRLVASEWVLDRLEARWSRQQRRLIFPTRWIFEKLVWC